MDEFDAPVGIASNPSSLAPADVIPAEDAALRRSSSRASDCLARSRVREGDLVLVGIEEEVEEVRRSDLVRRIRRGGIEAEGRRDERRERRERRT